MIDIFILIGLPGAGKSYWSEKYIETHNNVVCISRDKIREMLAVNYKNFPFEDHGEKNSRKWNKLEGEISNNSIFSSLNDGFSIIVDETHLTQLSRGRTINKIRQKYKDVRFIYVYLTEKERNLEYRMLSPKNSSEKKWNMVIKNMKSVFQEPTIEECKEFGIYKFYKVSREDGQIEITF